MARLTINDMMNRGLVGTVRRLLGMGAGISEIIAQLSLKFFGQANSTITNAANFALNTINSGQTIETDGSINTTSLPRVSGLSFKYRFIVRVEIDCDDGEGKPKTSYGTVYVDTNTNMDSDALKAKAITTQMSKWFSGMGSKALQDEAVCDEPSAEVIGAMRQR